MSQISQEIIHVAICFNTDAGLTPAQMFPVKFTKFLRTPNLKTIYERLLLCKELWI